MTESLDELIQKYSKGQPIQSKFLQEQYEDRQKHQKRMIMDPRDPNGRRLSHYWDKSDTVFSVTFKKVSNLVYNVLNPDTFTFQNLQKAKDRFILFDVYIMIGIFVVLMPIVAYAPFFLPRAKRVKQEYLMQTYFKKRFFETQLKLDKQKPISVREMKKILDQIQD